MKPIQNTAILHEYGLPYVFPKGVEMKEQLKEIDKKELKQEEISER